jgi:hypothetical protein
MIEETNVNTILYRSLIKQQNLFVYKMYSNISPLSQHRLERFWNFCVKQYMVLNY